MIQNLVVLESNYDPNMLMMGSYTYSLKKRVMSDRGHLSNEEAAKFCVDLVKRRNRINIISSFK